MIYEAWEGKSLAFTDILHHDAMLRDEPGSHVYWRVRGTNWTEAMHRYHSHHGWEEYKPILDADGTEIGDEPYTAEQDANAEALYKRLLDEEGDDKIVAVE